MSPNILCMCRFSDNQDFTLGLVPLFCLDKFLLYDTGILSLFYLDDVFPHVEITDFDSNIFSQIFYFNKGDCHAEFCI